MGRWYVMDYVVSESHQEALREAEGNYIAECLRVLTGNTQRFAGGVEIKNKLSEIKHPHVEKRTANEIITHIRTLLQ